VKVCSFVRWDDGIEITNAPPRQVELIMKDLCTTFSEHGLKIAIEANKKIANFLDVTLNLSNGTYIPYTKPNKLPLYIHKKSNHPPQIIKNTPKSINKRLSEVSSDQDSFDKAVPLYQKALNDSGFKPHHLAFSPTTA